MLHTLGTCGLSKSSYCRLPYISITEAWDGSMSLVRVIYFHDGSYIDNLQLYISLESLLPSTMTTHMSVMEFRYILEFLSSASTRSPRFGFVKSAYVAICKQRSRETVLK